MRYILRALTIMKVSHNVRFSKIAFLPCALFICALLITGLTNPAQAQPAEKHVKIRLLPERGDIKPGEELWIAVEQSIDPEWHTYWKNPGDSGSEPRINWALPNGFEISDIYWPIPYKIPYGPLVNYGYSDNVILLQKLTAPDPLPEGPLNLSADVEVLVCKEICIPEFGTYALTLNGAAGETEDNSAYLSSAREKLPVKTDWSVDYAETEYLLNFSFTDIGDFSFEGVDLSSIEFYPYDWGVVNNVAPIEARLTDGVLQLAQGRGDRPLSGLNELTGLLAYTTPDGHRQGLEFIAQKDRAAPIKNNSGAGKTALETAAQTGFLKAAFLALLGGLVLNLMPCVFPVLSIKALSLVKTAEKHPNQARIHGLSYTGGVVLSFLAIAGVLIALQAGGAQIGWGFQLQNPVVVTLLAYLLFIIGLNLSGVFEFSGRFTNIGGKLAQGHGYSNSFFTGILATLVATPCTAPFMGIAIGYALLQPALISLSVFAALGFGLALPYLLLSFIPKLQHILPKPGPWMDTFKQLLAFPMYASAAWLVWVVTQQAGPMGTLGALFGLVAIAFGLWLMTHKPKGKKARIFVIILTALSFLAALGFMPGEKIELKTQSSAKSSSFGEQYGAGKLDEALKGSDPVFVEMTAAWCITCKVNHATSLNIPETRALFEADNVRYLIGDWTNQNPEITNYLNSFGRNGVPIYVYYGPPNENGVRPEPEVLPQLLTPSIVAKVIEGD